MKAISNTIKIQWYPNDIILEELSSNELDRKGRDIWICPHYNKLTNLLK